jgi:hypothetical protein
VGISADRILSIATMLPDIINHDHGPFPMLYTQCVIQVCDPTGYCLICSPQLLARYLPNILLSAIRYSTPPATTIFGQVHHLTATNAHQYLNRKPSIQKSAYSTAPVSGIGSSGDPLSPEPELEVELEPEPEPEVDDGAGGGGTEPGPGSGLPLSPEPEVLGGGGESCRERKKPMSLPGTGPKS